MVKYYLHNSNYKESGVVVFGVPDNSGSHSQRKIGVEKAPDYIRKVSQKLDVFKWKGGKPRRVETNLGEIKRKVCDIGNVNKKEINLKVGKIVYDNKIPLVFGGDHSINSSIVKVIAKNISGKFAFVYFDAHHDFRCGFGDNYGSV